MPALEIAFSARLKFLKPLILANYNEFAKTIINRYKETTVSNYKEYTIIHKIKQTSSTIVRLDSQASQSFKAIHSSNNCK